mmetsp:Transcript_73202/g.65892  ORF Transcript_73202/g.65892 Transcript_73202/m.65892 type:complete len:456 (-) Transcript_73202:44-1411(-)
MTTRGIALATVLCSFLLDVTQSATAYSTSNADNIQTVYVSYDSGDTWAQLGDNSDWTVALELEIEGVNAATRLRYVVADVGVIGGFIATITYRGEEYVTTNPIGAGYFEVSKDSDVSDDDLVYHEASSSPWYILAKNELMSDDAYWIWDANINNAITFEFDFEEIAQPVTGAIYDEEADGDTVSMTCKHGINGIAAIYGANCRKGDQGSLPGGERQDGPMKEECYGKTSCDYTIDHTEIGDPCSGTVKDFYYAYTCTGNKYGVNVGSLGISEASGQSFTISCEGDDMVIKVADAIYGLNCQITPRVCGASAGLAYGTSASPLDVTDDLKTECNGKSSCTYNINHGKLGDPCSCVVKDYVYTYQCVPPRLVTMDEYEDMEADIDDIVDYELVVAHGIEEGQVNMMTLFINQTSIYVKAVVIFVGLLAVYGLYKLFADKLKNKLNSNGEYQRLLNQV